MNVGTWFGVILMYRICIPVAALATEEPSGPLDDHPEWLACASSSECTSVQLGCYYWQPINSKFASKAAATVACLQSVPAGPQPTASCLDHQCVNDPFTVRDWNALEPYQKNQLVDSRVEVCRAAADLPPYAADNASWNARLVAMLDTSIRGHQFPDNEILTATVKRIVPCEELITWEKGQEKWWDIQSKNKSTRRVVVERVRPTYPLDDLYPPLISYAKVFQRCGQNSSRRDVTFWGDMNVEFMMSSDGTIDPASVHATYPAVAYMHPYLDCAGTAFKKLIFPRPKDRRPVHVNALIQVQSVQP